MQRDAQDAFRLVADALEVFDHGVDFLHGGFSFFLGEFELGVGGADDFGFQYFVFCFKVVYLFFECFDVLDSIILMLEDEFFDRIHL